MAARGGRGVAPMAGKGSQGPCCEADSPPHPLVSGLGLPSVHWREVEEEMGEGADAPAVQGSPLADLNHKEAGALSSWPALDFMSVL